MDLVSVIMPCYNHAAFIQAAIDSILRQTHSELELIVVDDCSTDESADLIRTAASVDARVRFHLRSTNGGVSGARNDGIEMAQGTLIAFCDADDIWLPHKLEFQVELLRRSPAYGLTYCDSEIIDEHGKSTGRKFGEQYKMPACGTGNLFPALCETNFINIQTVLVRRSALPAKRPFDEGLLCLEDWWLWICVAARTQFVYDERMLAKYRVHAMSTNRMKQRQYQRDRWRVCRRNLLGHPDMPSGLQGLMWYSMGLASNGFGRRKAARAFMLRGFRIAVLGGGPLKRTLRMAARIAVSCSGPARKQKKETLGNYITGASGEEVGPVR
ncbi:MAG: glycosyltransferase [Chthoniobacteraceae bacterium]|jgi:glycosyltransferase involved in cell wall biosynthesis